MLHYTMNACNLNKLLQLKKKESIDLNCLIL